MGNEQIKIGSYQIKPVAKDIIPTPLRIAKWDINEIKFPLHPLSLVSILSEQYRRNKRKMHISSPGAMCCIKLENVSNYGVLWCPTGTIPPLQTAWSSP